MSRTAPQPFPDLSAYTRVLTATGEGAPPTQTKLEILNAARNQSADLARALDTYLVEDLSRKTSALLEAASLRSKLESIHERLTAAPWFKAVFLSLATTERGLGALVSLGGAQRVVTLADGLDPGGLAAGDELLLSSEQNVALARSPFPVDRTGESGAFDRNLEDGRMILRLHDDELIVQPVTALSSASMRPGDTVRFDRRLGLAFERIEKGRGEHLFLEEAPTVTFADIAGLDPQIARIERALLLHFLHRDLTDRYRLERKGSVLLVGSPGTGKTMLAQATANRVASLCGSGRVRFINVKPGALLSMWYGEAERNIRELFRVAFEAAEAQPDVPVVIFMDEIDSIAHSRGQSHMRADDRVLNALMAELDGLERRGNILLIAATNRRDAIDPAMLRNKRLGDEPIEVPRPNRDAAHQILGLYLPREIPYRLNGHASESAREEIVGAAVSRLYAPNGESAIATITFRDGRTRPVVAAELMSGASLAKIARTAKERACVRDIDRLQSGWTGESGVAAEDVMAAIGEELGSLARVLTPASCHRHLDDLPQDLDVVKVEPHLEAARRTQQYLVLG